MGGFKKNGSKRKWNEKNESARNRFPPFERD